MCTDHPVVQSLVGRIEDHRMVTYGENPQADVRLVDVSHAGGTSLFTIVFRDRTGSFLHEMGTSRCRCRGGITRSMPRRRSRWPTSSASATT